jgi:hypothetical protein
MYKWTLGQLGKQSQLKPIQSQFKANQSQLKSQTRLGGPIKCKNKPNSNPTCRGVASGEAGTNPMLVRHQCGGTEAKLHRLAKK